MNAILMATDFSDVATNAASYGVELAKTLNTTAILFNACEHSPLVIGEKPEAFTQVEMKDHSLKKIAEDARMLGFLHKWPVQTSCKTGSTHQAFQEAIHEANAKLLIMGMKKDRKGIQRVLGSTVSALLERLDIPLLLIPEDAKFTYILNIALAMDRNLIPEAYTYSLDFLRELTERFHSKLFIVQVTRQQVPENNHPLNLPWQLDWIKLKMNTEFERLSGKDVPDSLTTFVQSFDINVLVILAHRHSFFKRFLFKSNARTLAFECPVPLLVLPGKSAVEDISPEIKDQWQ